jgi:hypothetical protein
MLTISINGMVVCDAWITEFTTTQDPEPFYRGGKTQWLRGITRHEVGFRSSGGFSFKLPVEILHDSKDPKQIAEDCDKLVKAFKAKAEVK